MVDWEGSREGNSRKMNVGIEQKMEPTAPCEGNGYEEEDAAPIPTDLATAIELARGSDWLKDVMGELGWELYLQMGERELEFYNEHIANQVTPLERDRYLANF